MRMFGYYAFHTFINQLRKLCKTWVIILILVCVAMGFVIGAGTAILTSGDPEVYAETDADGNMTGRWFDDDDIYYYYLWDVEENYFLVDIDAYEMNDKWCIVSTSSHYDTLNNTGREVNPDGESTAPNSGDNPQTLTDQAGNTFTQLTEEELSEIGNPEKAGDNVELLRSTLYRDENQITYVLLEDDCGMFYVLPFIYYYDFASAYDDLLDYDNEYLYYCMVYPDYDPYYIQEIASESEENGTTDPRIAERDLADPEIPDTGTAADETAGDSDDLIDDINFWNTLAAATDPDAIFIDQGGHVFFLPTGETICISSEGMVECIAFLIILVLLIYFVLGADKNGGRIFLMADVNILFASPLKPQSVLLFRLMMKLAVILIWVGYFGFLYSPELIDMGATPGGEILIILTIALVIGYALVLQVMLYTISATNRKNGKRAYIVLAIPVILLLAGYTLYWRNSGVAPLPAFIGFLRNPTLRYIPIIGWGKAAAALSFSGNYTGAALWIGLLIIGLAGLIMITWRIKADFYEDAMEKSEEVAALQEKVKERGSLFAFSNKKRLQKAAEREEEEEREAEEREKEEREKEEREKEERETERVTGASGNFKIKVGKPKTREGFLARLTSDGLGHGWGASVYFWKAMHIRFRFGTFVYFTKTTFIYLALALGVSLFGRLVLQEDMLLVGALAIGVFAFYRCLGNALQEDIEQDSFRMIPGSTWGKVFFSLLGMITNSLLDLIPAYLVLIIAFRASLETAIGYIILTLSVQLYATTVGAFMDVSIPINAGAAIKQTVQVLFIYFGLLPDAGILAFGIASDAIPLAAVISFLVNLALTCLFITLTANILSPYEGSIFSTPSGYGMSSGNSMLSGNSMSSGNDITGAKDYIKNIRFHANRRRIRKTFSRIGWGALILYAAGSLAQVVTSAIIVLTDVDVTNPVISYAITFLPLYLIGFPAGILFLKRLPVTHADETADIGSEAAKPVPTAPAEPAAAPTEPAAASTKPVTAITSHRMDFNIPQMIKLFFIMIFFGYTGSYIANMLNDLIISIFGAGTSNVAAELVTSDSTLEQIIFLCILAPCLEELFFRKVIIDRVRRFGEVNAVVFTAVIFGLFHGNLTQFIYAGLLGLVLGYVYLRTEKLRYSISLHMAFNFMGSIVAGKVNDLVMTSLTALDRTDAGTFDVISMLQQYLNGSLTTADPAGSSLAAGANTGSIILGLVVYLIYIAVILLMWVIGLILFIMSVKHIRFYEADEQIPSGRTFAITWLNPGMIIFTILMCIMMIVVIALSVIALSL